MRGTLNDGTGIMEWLEFFDPSDPKVKFKVMTTFILSGYECDFGRGCPGLLNRGEVRTDCCCCERGVTFTGDEDFANVEKHVGELTAEDCDNIEHVRNKGWYQKTPKDGKPYKTRKMNDRCIFSNMNGGSAGKPGCAFHHLAERTGQRMIDTKPEICWTNPIAFHWDYDENLDVETLSILPFDSDDWGGTDDSEDPDGKGHMGYWCTDTPDAYQHESQVWSSHEAEFRKKMGDAGYDELVRIIKANGWDKQRTTTRMPGEVRNDGRPMIPLLIAERT